jgi:hypothetical protein
LTGAPLKRRPRLKTRTAWLKAGPLGSGCWTARDRNHAKSSQNPTNPDSAPLPTNHMDLSTGKPLTLLSSFYYLDIFAACVWRPTTRKISLAEHASCSTGETDTLCEYPHPTCSLNSCGSVFISHIHTYYVAASRNRSQVRSTSKYYQD